MISKDDTLPCLCCTVVSNWILRLCSKSIHLKGNILLKLLNQRLEQGYSFGLCGGQCRGPFSMANGNLRASTVSPQNKWFKTFLLNVRCPLCPSSSSSRQSSGPCLAHWYPSLFMLTQMPWTMNWVAAAIST